ncbi:hypothetical protein LOTGIDRAFT_170295 [Lottia gigantea]|uniref:Uncharacterized protein n=1 Tax=Lottia gigantea TaxID=225164 RepID=V4B1M4_LOTGI|nr:hypothetical protein LOTGIDRAFT_170295 [Lottia gigantea]ESO82149.1 hypothetical protein LOTGIDRAFT_170295 [Lottia gigantea]
MANKFGLGSLSLETKKPNTTAWINKAKSYFVDQIGDTLQGDLDMNNFKVTNLKFPENDNDAVHKKYLRDQINSIEVNKNHLEDKISNVKRFFKRQLNNKNFVNETKLQQEVKGLISFIQKELVNLVNKTELQNLISLISKLEDKITKQKLDIQQLIDNIPDENEDTFQQELNALETKLNSELQKELRNIKQQIKNIDDSEIKTYIQQQIQNIDDSEIKTYIQQQIQNIDDSVIQQQITTINNLVLKQDKNIVALEKKYFKKESYYFNLPFGGMRRDDPSITDNIDKSKDYKYKKYGFTANIRVYSVPDGIIYPQDFFDIDDNFHATYFTFRGKHIIEITFSFSDLNPTDTVPEEFYNKLMNIVEIFVGKDSIDQMLQRLGKIDQKRITLISHNGSGFNNWIVLKNAKKLTQCPLVTARGILSLPLSNSFTDEYLQKKSLRHEWEPYAKRDTLCLRACLIKYNKVMKEVVFQNIFNDLTAPSLSLKGWYYVYHYNKEIK